MNRSLASQSPEINKLAQLTTRGIRDIARVGIAGLNQLSETGGTPTYRLEHLGYLPSGHIITDSRPFPRTRLVHRVSIPEKTKIIPGLTEQTGLVAEYADVSNVARRLVRYAADGTPRSFKLPGTTGATSIRLELMTDSWPYGTSVETDDKGTAHPAAYWNCADTNPPSYAEAMRRDLNVEQLNAEIIRAYNERTIIAMVIAEALAGSLGVDVDMSAMQTLKQIWQQLYTANAITKQDDERRMRLGATFSLFEQPT